MNTPEMPDEYADLADLIATTTDVPIAEAYWAAACRLLLGVPMPTIGPVPGSVHLDERDGDWLVRWQDGDGKRRQRAYATYSEADAFRRHLTGDAR